MFNAENHLGANLHVVKMKGWNRADWYDETGLAWINPSPNLRDLTEATLYPGVGMAEGSTSVSAAVRTRHSVLGAPWIDARKLAEYLNGRHIQGVRFSPIDFTRRRINSRQDCRGVQIIYSTARPWMLPSWEWSSPPPCISSSPMTSNSIKTSSDRLAVRAGRNKKGPRSAPPEL
jgi:uncharacterized protein YbbC (DUF1343 family)